MLLICMGIYWSSLSGNIGIRWGAWTLYQSCISNGCAWLHCFSWKWCIYTFILWKHGKSSRRSSTISWTQENNISWQARRFIFWIYADLSYFRYHFMAIKSCKLILFLCFYLFHRKALVRLIDKLEQGTLKEGKNLSNRVIEMHMKRYDISHQTLWSSIRITWSNQYHFWLLCTQIIIFCFLNYWMAYKARYFIIDCLQRWLNRQGSARKRKGPISGTKGTERFRSEEPFYVNPLPDCLCKKEFPMQTTLIVSDNSEKVYSWGKFLCWKAGDTTMLCNLLQTSAVLVLIGTRSVYIPNFGSWRWWWWRWRYIIALMKSKLLE